MVKHIDSWLAFARRLGLGIEEVEEIILVTGCDRTRSWTNVAFLGDQVDARVSFGVKVEGPDTGINFQFSPENAQGAVFRHGPEGTVRLYNTPFNQSTVLRPFLSIRTCPKINVYLSEDFVLLVPSGYCQGVLKRTRLPLQT
jgi:hypothetical protein